MDKLKKWIKPVLIIAAVAAVLVLGGKYLGLQQRMADALGWIKGLGPAGRLKSAIPADRWSRCANGSAMILSMPTRAKADTISSA